MTFAESRETEHFEVIKVKEAEITSLKLELEKLKKSIKKKEKDVEDLNKEILKIQDEKLDIQAKLEEYDGREVGLKEDIVGL